MTPAQAEAKAEEIVAQILSDTTPRLMLEITYALQFAYADGYKAGLDAAVEKIAKAEENALSSERRQP